MSNTTVTPVLSSTVGYVDDMRDQIANVLRYVIMNPGWTSSLWEDDLGSFRVMSSKHEIYPEQLCNVLKTKLLSIYRRMFPDYEIEPEVTYRPYVLDDQGNVDINAVADSTMPPPRYTVIFSITIAQNGQSELAIISGTITTDPDTGAISVNFSNTSDHSIF